MMARRVDDDSALGRSGRALAAALVVIGVLRFAFPRDSASPVRIAGLAVAVGSYIYAMYQLWRASRSEFRSLAWGTAMLLGAVVLILFGTLGSIGLLWGINPSIEDYFDDNGDWLAPLIFMLMAVLVAVAVVASMKLMDRLAGTGAGTRAGDDPNHYRNIIIALTVFLLLLAAVIVLPALLVG